MRMTIDLPAELHSLLRKRAESGKVSMRSLVVLAVEERFGRVPMTGAPIRGSAAAGPLPLDRENPWDLIFGDAEFVP
jgi:hypothetical protein